MTGITIYNVQRAVAPKAGNSEIWFLCSAHHISDDIQNIPNSFQVTERTHILQKSLFTMFKGP